MILGWSINTEKFLRYCIENKVGTCSSYDKKTFQCLCLDSW